MGRRKGRRGGGGRLKGGIPGSLRLMSAEERQRLLGEMQCNPFMDDLSQRAVTQVRTGGREGGRERGRDGGICRVTAQASCHHEGDWPLLPSLPPSLPLVR